MHKLFKHHYYTPLLLLAFYVFTGVTSVYNLGRLAAIGYIIILMACCHRGRIPSAIVLIMSFYLPNAGVNLPFVFVLTTIIVVIFNYKVLIKNSGYSKCKYIFSMMVLFLAIRIISITFVEDIQLFEQYFLWGIFSLVQLYIIMNLIKSDMEVYLVLRWWGYIGCLATILGFIHFYYADMVYLRTLNQEAGGMEKGVMDLNVGWIRWIWAGCEPNVQGLQLLIPFVINLSICFKKINTFNFILTFTSFLGIVGTFSRTSFMCAACAVVYMLLLTSNKNKYIAIAAITIAILFSYKSLPEYIERVSSISEDISTKGGNGRFELYGESIKNFFYSPIVGIGTGQTMLYSPSKHEAHNTFLQTLGENGIFGFLIIISLFGKYLLDSFKFRKKNNVFFIVGFTVIINMNTVTFYDMRSIISFMALFYIVKYNLIKNNSNNESIIRNISCIPA